MQVFIAVAILIVVIVLSVRKYYKVFTGKRSACDCGCGTTKKHKSGSTCDCGCAGCHNTKNAN